MQRSFLRISFYGVHLAKFQASMPLMQAQLPSSKYNKLSVQPAPAREDAFAITKVHGFPVHAA
jgi:hypothetical protein